MTLTLFTSTLAISFLVVGLPHLIPCPVPTRTYADGADPRKRRRRKAEAEGEGGLGDQAGGDNAKERGRVRECPVPKPGGLVGQILGVKGGEGREEMKVVRVERFEGGRRRRVKGDGEG